MATSTTRYLVRGVLVVMILFVVALLVLIMRRDQPERSWEQAQASAEAGDNGTAILHLRRLLQKDPKNIQGHLLLADLLLEEAREKDPKASFASERPAMAALIAAAELSPDNLDVQRKLMHAFVDYGGESEAVAIKSATIVARLDENDATAQYVLARQAQKAGQLEEALVLLDKVSALEKKPTLKTLMAKAQTVYAMNDAPRTNALIEEAVALTNTLTDAELLAMTGPSQRQLMRLLSDGVVVAPSTEAGLHRMAVALDVFERLLPLVKNEPEMVGYLGESAAKAHLAVLPLFSASTANAETVALRAATSARVKALCNEAIKAQTAGPLVYWALARAAFTEGSDDAGFRYLDQGIVRAASNSGQKPEDVLRLHHLYATQLMRSGRFHQTDPHVKVLLESSDDTYKGWAHLVSGLVAMVDGNKDESIDHISKARQIMGDKFIVNVTMAENLLRLGMKEEALEYLERIHPQLAQLNEAEAHEASQGFLGSAPQVHLAQAQTLIDLARLAEAEQHLVAVEADPKLAPRAHELRVKYLWSAGHRDEALKRLAAARQAYPRDLGLALVEVTALWEDDKARGDQILRGFVEANPENLEAHYQLVSYLLREGRREEVDAMLVTMNERFPDKPVVKLIESQLYLNENEWEKANALAYEIEKMPSGKSIGLAIRAQVALRTENYEEAARLFAQMDADGRNGASLLLVKSMAEARSGDVSQSLDTLAGVLGVSSMRTQVIALLQNALDGLIADEGPEATELKVDKLLAKHPNDPFLLFQRWKIALMLQKFDVAQETVNRLDTIQPEEKIANDFMRGRTYLAAGRPDLALKLIESLLPLAELSKAKPEQLGLIVEGAEAAVALGEFQKALDYSRGALKLNNQYWDAYLTQATALRGLKEHAQAIEVAKGLVAAQPKMLKAHEQLFSEYFAAARFEDALAAARDGQARFAGADDAAQQRAALKRLEIVALCQLDRHEELDSMDPDDMNVTLTKAVSWSQLKKFDQAISELERGLKLDPRSTDARALAAQLCFKQERYAEAAGHAVAALGQNPNLANLQILQARAQFKLGQFDAAFEILRNLIGKEPNNPEPYVVLAMLLLENDRPEEALATVEDGLLRLPKNSTLVQLQVEILASSNRVPEAEKLIFQFAGEKPPADICIHAVHIFTLTGHHDAAAAWVERARAAGTPAVRCDALLGDVRMTQGVATNNRDRLAEAVKYFEQVVASDPSQIVSANNLALLLGTHFGQPERGLAVLDAAVKGRPREELPTEIIDTYVRIWRSMERLDEAMQLIDKALQRNPDQALLLYQKGMILLRNGQADGAREALARAITLGLSAADHADAERALDSLK